MKESVFFFFLLFTLLPTNSQQKEENHLSPVISDLSIVVRLINGISVQSELMRSSQNLNEVVGELLGIGDSIPELLKVKVKDLMKDVEGVMEAVKTLPPSSSQNLEGVGDAVKFLASVDVEKVKTELKRDLTPLNDNWSTADDARTDMDPFLSDDFLSAVASFKYSMTPNDNDAQKKKMDELANFFAKSPNIKKALERVKRKLPDMKDLKAIVGTKSKIENYSYLSNIAKQYSEMGNVLVGLPKSFTGMKDSLKTLNPVVEKGRASSTDSQILEAIDTVFSTVQSVNKSLTAGLPNGISDLKMLFDDLNGKWLKENVADGKDMKMLVTALQPLQKVYENLKPTEASWGKLRENQMIGEVAGNIASILKNGKIVKPDELIPKADQSAKCAKILKQMSPDPDYKSVEYLFQEIDDFDSQLKMWMKAAEKATSSPAFQKAVAFKWSRLKLDTSTATDADLEKELKSLRTNKDIREIGDLVFGLVQTIESIDFEKIKKVFDSWTAVTGIHDGIIAADLVPAVECLKKMSFDFAAVEAFSYVDQGVQALKPQNDAQQYMKVFEEAMDSLISADKKMKETVDGMKSSTRRRRRRGVEEKGLLKLADSSKLTQVFARGVQVLRDMSEVFENQEKVLGVAKSDAAVDTVIQGIPEMAGKWTADNKKALEKLVDEVNTLNRNVGSDRSLKGVWKQFSEALSVNGAPIEGRILGTLVHEVLEKSTDTNVKNAAGDFKDFPPLQLDFTGSKRANLQDASLILHTITEFFKNFFTIQRITDTSTQPSDSSPNYLLFAGAGAGGLALVAALGVGGYYGSKVYKKKMIWKNRERYWIYIPFLNNDHESSFDMLIDGRQFDQMKQLIEKGYYINLFLGGESILHFAVQRRSPIAVEMLIVNGADRRALSDKMKTPEQSIEKIDPGICEETKENIRKISKIFEKYRGKTFPPKVPELMPWSKFIVCSLAADVSAEFRLMYQKQIPFKNRPNLATHLIVDVDDNGVYHCKKNKPLSIFYEVVFGPVITVSSEWANLCVKSVKNMYKDYDCRVKKVEFNGKVYTNVDRMKEFARERHIKYGYGINLAYLKTKGSENEQLVMNLTDLGFNVFMVGQESKHRHVMDADPKAKSFYRPEINANFIVYDGDSIEDHAAKLEGVDLNEYTLMSLDEITVFLLELKITGGKEASQFPIKASTPTKTKTTSTSKTNSTSKATSVVKSTQ